MRVVVVGAGLAGCLFAMLLAKRGARVTLFERNPDPRPPEGRAGSSSSINLTLVERGFAALAAAGLRDQVRAISVPVNGRCIHVDRHDQEYQPYGNPGEALRSVSRATLNKLLLDAAARTPGVELRFGQRCIELDVEQGRLVFESAANGTRYAHTADLIVGADGARSTVRLALQRRHGVNFSQLYSRHTNKELRIPAEYARRAGLANDALHVWPRGDLMLLGFPNVDGDITCTLQLPSTDSPTSFAAIRTERGLLRLFEEHFADALPLIPDLVRDFFDHPEIPMVTIRCEPWSCARVTLIGDAAHAVWPAYGQGANAAFETCTILDACLARNGSDLRKALAEYEQLRRPDTNAIADLSERHFTELRSHLRDPRFLLRKRIERRVRSLFPEQRSLYERIAFTVTPYAEAIRQDVQFRRVVDAICASDELCADVEGAALERFIRAHFATASEEHASA
ncbi:MAG: FAD-dependent monooxygenase [Deltaproteobacteria bacterium]|nr:FAD-dependent monooxygenase [Deltaproteobacteria bacterium]